MNAEQWIKITDKKPDEEGSYLVYAKSLDPHKPFFSVCFWDKNGFWLGIPNAWVGTISHWAVLEIPNDEKIAIAEWVE